MYWRAFDRAEELDHKLDVVAQADRAVPPARPARPALCPVPAPGARRPRPGEQGTRTRDVAMCVAQAHASSGDMGSARAELEKLLATDTRDTRLLSQLSKLAEEDGDLETAARYQKMLEELASSDEGQARLATLLARSGDIDEAQTVWSKAAAGKNQSFRVYFAMDNLLLNNKPLPVLELTEGMLRTDPQNWEALYRQGLALEQLGRPKEAAARFQKLIDLPVGDDEKSDYAKAKAKNPQLQASGAPNLPIARLQSAVIPLEERVVTAFYIRYFCKLMPWACATRLLLVAGRFRTGPHRGAGLAGEPCGERTTQPPGGSRRDFSHFRSEITSRSSCHLELVLPLHHTRRQRRGV